MITELGGFKVGDFVRVTYSSGIYKIIDIKEETSKEYSHFIVERIFRVGMTVDNRHHTSVVQNPHSLNHVTVGDIKKELEKIDDVYNKAIRIMEEK